MAGVPISGGAPLPLGSVLVVQAAGWEATIHFPGLAAAHRASPWAPLVIVGPSAPLIDLLPLILGSLKALHVEPANDGGELASSIWQTVRRRPPPGQQEIAWHCGLQLGQSPADLIAAALGGAAYRSLRRRLREMHFAPPVTWQRRFKVLHALSLAWGRQWTETSAAAEVGIASETLSRACRRCFGLTWPGLIRIGTWEGALEQALRWDREISTRRGRLD
ncbi:MAG TPA: hypothetical protein PLL69_02055 [Gemmatimonadales bacterium]|nr:hypothetical protein [Gemmatimonadales bacterium]